MVKNICHRSRLMRYVVILTVIIILLQMYINVDDHDHTNTPNLIVENSLEEDIYPLDAHALSNKVLTTSPTRPSSLPKMATVRDRTEHYAMKNSKEPYEKETSPSTNFANTSHKHVLVIGRMTTGSKAMAEFFSKRPDFFYVYEPGHMIMYFGNGRNLQNDSRAHLQELQTPLLNFMNDIYHCNFTKHQYFIKGMNIDNSVYRLHAGLQRPITEGALTILCRSKNVLSKTVRVNDIATYSDMLRKNDVKVIFLARDPRGMASSRFRRFVDKKNIAPSQKRLMLDEYVREHCVWLQRNYDSITKGPTWLRENTMIVRYEDLVTDRRSIRKLLIEFIGLSPQSEDTDSESDSESHSASLTKWLNNFTYDEVKRIQNLCSDRIFDIFGWVKVANEQDFERENQTWCRPILNYRDE
ncbi:carbohydrate sulfotransferase 1-like [Glandiceps talaboti]